jgi:hypothetical protein
MKQSSVSRRSFLSGGAVAGAVGTVGAAESPTFSETVSYKQETLKERLIEHMEGLTIIDAHEHLMSEEESLADGGLDIMGALLNQYVPLVLSSAGMGKKREWLRDRNVPLDERWQAFKEYLPYVVHTGLYDTINMAVQALYGIKRLDESNFYEVNERIRNDLKPGYYDRLLKGHCKIERILNQRPWGKNDGYDDFVTDITLEVVEFQWSSANLRRLWEKYGSPDMNIDEFAENWISSYAGKHHGIKIHSGIPFPKPSFEEAQTQFAHYQKDRTGTRDKACLYLLHKAIELCGKYNLTVAVHCGIFWDCWRDFYKTSIENIVPFAMTYRDTIFDIYHAGMPWVREAGVAGNQYPNVNLNLTWTHEISPVMTKSFLNEWIDLVPLNKIIGFGADSETPFLTAGNRRRTFDNIAEVLARRVTGGEMSIEEAEEICRMWLYDNPKKIYRL